MKQKTVRTKTADACPRAAYQSVDPGKKGASAAPPFYGIDFIDRPQPNRTGLPDRLKAGVESLSGLSLDKLRVHYNSPKPAQLQALAYTQGADIHVAPGHERHLAHEAWHAVQQAQGRVRPTLRMRGTLINNDPALESEADRMGVKSQRQGSAVAARTKSGISVVSAIKPASPNVSPVQMIKCLPNEKIKEENWTEAGPGNTLEFTALAAGCLAVVVEFAGGGGAGVHLAMVPQSPDRDQWTAFKAGIGGRPVARVFLYGDMVGQPQGWYVNSTGIEFDPRSAWTLPNPVPQGWEWKKEIVLNWFSAVLGAPEISFKETNEEVSHLLPGED